MFNNLNLISMNVLKRTVNNLTRFCTNSIKFETVFVLPSVKYIAIFNRLKVYHIIGNSAILPSCAALELSGLIPSHTFFSATYIGLTSGALLALASKPFKNVIGFLYISEDNKEIKISAVDYWGKRKDRIIPADDWTPMLMMTPKPMDAIYLTPTLKDGSTYKLFVKFGKILNSSKMGEVLE